MSGLLEGVGGSIEVLALYGTILSLEKTMTVLHSNGFATEFLPKEKLPLYS